LITFNWIHRKKDGTDFLADISRLGGQIETDYRFLG